MFVFVFCNLLFNSCVYDCKKNVSNDELLGKYKLINPSPDLDFTEYIYLLDSVNYVHEIFNDTLYYLDTSRYHLLRSNGDTQIRFKEFNNIFKITPGDYLITDESGFFVCWPYIGINERRYKKLD